MAAVAAESNLSLNQLAAAAAESNLLLNQLGYWRIFFQENSLSRCFALKATQSPGFSILVNLGHDILGFINMMAFSPKCRRNQQNAFAFLLSVKVIVAKRSITNRQQWEAGIKFQ